MVDIIPLIPLAKNPTPSLPGQIAVNPPKVQPGAASSAAPIIPSVNPPNVDGGAASFSSLTRSIKDLVDAKTVQLDASAKAIQANAAVDASANQVIESAQQSSIKAFTNIQKASSLPGGPKGKLAGIIGLFDSDYNMDYQRTQVDLGNMRAQTAAATAQALKEQNNALPALLGKVSEATKVVFDAQKDANDLVIKQGTLDQQIINTRIAAAHLKIAMSQEHRAATDFAIRGMTTQQIEAALPQAEAGKGKFAGLGGLLKERLVNEKAAEVSLSSAMNSLAAGNRKEYEDNLSNMVSHLPLDFSQAQYEKAKAGGGSVVTLPTGQIDPKTKQSSTIDIPFNVFEQGIIRATETNEKVNTATAARITQRLNIIPNATNMFNTTTAFASLDPRATQLSSQLGSVMQQLNPKDPDSVFRTGIVLNDLAKQRDEIVKDQAAKFHDPEAKAGILNFGKTGKFDSQGGVSVVTESAGNPALNRNSKFASFWTDFNTQIATIVQTERASGTGFGAQGQNGNVNSVDAMAMIAALTNKPQGKEKIATIAQNILADPLKAKAFARTISGVMRVDTINSTISGLMHQKDADPIWHEIDAHAGNYLNKDGQIDTNKIFAKLEQATVKSGGKLNYARQFLSAMQNYAITANNAPASDTSYTMQDHAAVAALFGGNPESDVAGNLHWELRMLADRHHKEMQDRINQDVTGQTQKQAIKQAGIIDAVAEGILNPYGQILPSGAKKLLNKTGVDINAVPSATGTGLTAAEIAAKFPGGY